MHFQDAFEDAIDTPRATAEEKENTLPAQDTEPAGLGIQGASSPQLTGKETKETVDSHDTQPTAMAETQSEAADVPAADIYTLRGSIFSSRCRF